MPEEPDDRTAILESLERQITMIHIEPSSPVEAKLANVLGCLIAVMLHDARVPRR